MSRRFSGRLSQSVQRTGPTKRSISPGRYASRSERVRGCVVVGSAFWRIEARRIDQYRGRVGRGRSNVPRCHSMGRAVPRSRKMVGGMAGRASKQLRSLKNTIGSLSPRCGYIGRKFLSHGQRCSPAITSVSLRLSENGSSGMGRSWFRNCSQIRKKSALVVARRMSCRNWPLGSTPMPR